MTPSSTNGTHTSSRSSPRPQSSMSTNSAHRPIRPLPGRNGASTPGSIGTSSSLSSLPHQSYHGPQPRARPNRGVGAGNSSNQIEMQPGALHSFSTLPTSSGMPIMNLASQGHMSPTSTTTKPNQAYPSSMNLTRGTLPSVHSQPSPNHTASQQRPVGHPPLVNNYRNSPTGVGNAAFPESSTWLSTSASNWQNTNPSCSPDFLSSPPLDTPTGSEQQHLIELMIMRNNPVFNDGAGQQQYSSQAMAMAGAQLNGTGARIPGFQRGGMPGPRFSNGFGPGAGVGNRAFQGPMS